MKQLFLIMVFGALGSAARFGMGLSARHFFGKSFPYDTLIVNVIGCLIIGFIMHGVNAASLSDTLKTALVVGFLGAFTTFSAFGYATFDFLRQGALVQGIANTLANLVLGLLAVWIGMTLARVMS